MHKSTSVKESKSSVQYPQVKKFQSKKKKRQMEK